MKTKSFEQQVEAQQLISNINTMRSVIGLTPLDFNYLWKQSIEWLRKEQEIAIEQYNQALKNKVTK